VRAVGRPDGETEDRRGSRIGREEGGRYLGIPQNPGQPAHQPVIINPVSTKPGAVHRAADLRPHGWRPPQTLQIPDWCGCSTEYLPVPVGDGWWSLVPIWEPSQTASPLRRWEPPVPYWAMDP
jgi:hypothetical protein